MLNKFKKAGPIQKIFFILFLVINAWLITHIYALTGILLILAYLFLWMFYREHVLCLICKFRKTDCRTSHIVGNMTFLTLVYFLSIGLVYIENRVAIDKIFNRVDKTVYFSVPARSQRKINEIFPLKIELNEINSPINAVQTDIEYDPKLLEVVDVSIVNSFATIFIDKVIDNKVGFARVSGGIPNPGFKGDKGLFITVYWRARSAGLAVIKFLPSSLVLANDGHGTNLLSNLGSVNYLIIPEYASSEESMIPNNVLGTSLNNPRQMVYFKDDAVKINNTIVKSTVGQESAREKIIDSWKALNDIILSPWKWILYQIY